MPKFGKTREIVAESVADACGASLDCYYITIPGELQGDPRLSNAELAARIGLSAAPTWRRVKCLER
jgi:DNA-binding Lrp family transcriptional regulator